MFEVLMTLAPDSGRTLYVILTYHPRPAKLSGALVGESPRRQRSHTSLGNEYGKSRWLSLHTADPAIADCLKSPFGPGNESDGLATPGSTTIPAVHRDLLFALPRPQCHIRPYPAT
jgi:hypothetical protein